MTALDRRYDTQIHRRVTRTVMVGDVPVGSEHPIVVQSMINEDTLDIEAAVAGIIRLAEAGSEIVRVTTPSMAHAKAMGQIRQELRQRGCTVPLQNTRLVLCSKRKIVCAHRALCRQIWWKGC